MIGCVHSPWREEDLLIYLAPGTGGKMIKIFEMQGEAGFLGECQSFFGEEWLRSEAKFQDFVPHFQTVGSNHCYTIREDVRPCCLRTEESDQHIVLQSPNRVKWMKKYCWSRPTKKS